MAKKTLLRGGTVLSMDETVGDIDNGDVLIEGANIVAVAPNIEAEVDDVIDVSGAIVMPGLIDTHIHLWQTPVRGVAAGCWGMEYFGVVHPLSARYRPEDMYAATYGGAAELLKHGVTTALDFCHSVNSPAHADASMDGLTDAGIRALFGYGFRDRPEVEARAFDSLDARIRDVQRLHDERRGASDGRVGLACALNNIDHVTPADHARELGCARELGIRATLHSNLPDQVGQSAEQNLLGEDIIWVHCGAIEDGELALLARHGGSIASTPEIEAGLMAIKPVVGRAVRSSVPVGLGVDIPSAVNADLLAQLRVTYALDRLLDSEADRLDGRAPQRGAETPTLDARRLLELATVEAAQVVGLGDETGSLTPGKLADITVLSTEPFGLGGGDPVSHAIFQASAADVNRVFVGGRQVVQEGKLVEIDERKMGERLNEARDYVLGRSGDDAAWPEMSAAERAQYEARQGAPAT